MRNNFLFAVVLILFLSSSCISKKRIVYLQGKQDFNAVSNNYDPIIQRDDRLSIIVTSLEVEAARPFNLNQNSTGNVNLNNNPLATYLVDVEGKIEFPVLGTISVEGFTLNQLRNILREKLAVYLKSPVINVTINNFKVTVLGEVQVPGIVSFNNHRVTLLDAIASAGDLTAFGKRQNILIIRDYQGIKTFNRVDITKADFVNSPFYYLDQNDVIYVEQRKTKMDATALPNLPIILSIVTFITTVVLLINR
jgi:polysaccharide export outer membrane protein